MRLFVALVPPDEALEHLDEFLEIRRDAADFRWSDPGQFHVTLAFLAAAPERRLDDLVERLGRAAQRRTPVATRLAGGGAFPDPARARVLWTGLDLDEAGRVEVGRMATGARAAAVRAGIEVAGQRFRPHVTVARMRRPEEVSSWVRLLEGYQGPPWRTAHYTLVQSHLGEGPRRRPRYETLETFPVGRDVTAP